MIRNHSARAKPSTASIPLCSVLVALGLALGLAAPLSAQEEPVVRTTESEEPLVLHVPEFEEPLFSIDSPIGPFEYRAGRGLRFGDTGLRVGGFTTFEFDQEQGASGGEFELDSVNLLVLFEPIPEFALFSEIEFGDLLIVETDTGKSTSDLKVELERLYGEWRFSDSLKTRVGKFQTPVGRWNLVPAEPFVWTAIEPVGVEVAFDEYLTGAAFQGTLYRGADRVDYWAYGQATRQLEPEDDDLDPARAVGGGRLQWGRQNWSLGSSFLAAQVKDRWSFLGGLDAEVQLGPLELTTEFMIERGDVAERVLTDVYVQGVLELCGGLYGVTRYEYFDGRGHSQDVHLVDVGLAWIPLPFLHVKGSYRFADRQTDEVSQGVSTSVSIVF